MPVDDGRERRPEGVDVERAADPHSTRAVEGRRAGLPLIEEPHALLGERERVGPELAVLRDAPRRSRQPGAAAAAQRGAAHARSGAVPRGRDRRRPPGFVSPATGFIPASALLGDDLASAPTVGAVKRACSGMSPWRRRIRVIICVASSEWPPSAKKSSSTPTCSTPSSVLPRSPRSPPRASLRGATYSALGGELGRRRLGQRAPIDLPARRERQRRRAGRTPTGPCTRAATRRGSERSSSTRRLRRRDDVGDEALVAGGAVARRRRRLAHRRMPQQRGLDLAGLDAEAADLDLLVDAAEELDRAVGQPARAVAGAVDPRRRRPANGSATKRSAVSSGRFDVAARHTGAADAELARQHPAAAAARCASSDVGARVRERPADRHGRRGAGRRRRRPRATQEPTVVSVGP